MAIILVSCQNPESYRAKDIEIKENIKREAINEDPQINGMYEVTEDTNLYSDLNGKEAFDTLDKGSIVTILEEEEDGFIRVDYNGNEGYVKVSLLKGI